MRFLRGSFLNILSLSIVLFITTYHFSYACEQRDETIPQVSFLQLADNAAIIVVAKITAIENNIVSVEISQYLKGGGASLRVFHKPSDSPCDENLVVGEERIIFAKGRPNKIGVFIQGRTIRANERNLHLIGLNAAQNDFLHKKSCAAVYDGEYLTIPCVKTLGNEVITQAQLQKIETSLDFTLKQAIPYYVLTAPQINTDNTNNLTPTYANIDTVTLLYKQDSVQIFALVQGHFSNSCEYFKPKPVTEVRVNKKNIFPLFLTVSTPYAGQECSEAQRPFSLKIELLTQDLPAGEYLLQVNESHTEIVNF